METYRLLPAEGTTWHVVPNHLMEQIPRAWPQAEIIIKQPLNRPGYQWSWSITFDPERDSTADSLLVSGWLADTLQEVVLHGDVEPAVEFALWFRRLVAGDQPIIFEDESQTYRTDIHAQTRTHDILCIFTPDLPSVAWQILNVLKARGGLEVAHILLTQLQLQEQSELPGDVVQYIDHALSMLWEHGYISSPSMNWLPQRSASISDIVTNEYWSRMRIGLTSSGERVILARAALNSTERADNAGVPR